MTAKIPVTVLTGFLGAGKTTLLNRILSEHHGQRIAVIENEFGEIGIDQALVIQADEEVFEMNNGCICCTVRGDLIRILGSLVKRRAKFDRVLLETTGMADPGPVAQTFFVDDDIRESFELDGIVTMVDAKHVALHLDDSSECREQIAFADVLVLNKTDLVPVAELEQVEQRIRGMNALAKLVRSSHADVPITEVLDIGGFDLERALDREPTFLEPEYPFEWAGIIELGEGLARLEFDAGPDPSIDVLARRLAGPDEDGLDRAGADQALRQWTQSSGASVSGTQFLPEQRQTLDLRGPGPHHFDLRVSAPGRYVLLTEHHPSEFAMRMPNTPLLRECTFAGHEHDDEVGSVGLRVDQPLVPEKVQAWLGTLLREQGADIFRMKGILDFGDENRFVFQGVHMLFDGREDLPWAAGPRRSELVFIGRNLDLDALERGFADCLA